MKKKIIYILITLFLFIPSSVKAANKVSCTYTMPNATITSGNTQIPDFYASKVLPQVKITVGSDDKVTVDWLVSSTYKDKMQASGYGMSLYTGQPDSIGRSSYTWLAFIDDFHKEATRDGSTYFCPALMIYPDSGGSFTFTYEGDNIYHGTEGRVLTVTKTETSAPITNNSSAKKCDVVTKQVNNAGDTASFFFEIAASGEKRFCPGDSKDGFACDTALSTNSLILTFPIKTKGSDATLSGNYAIYMGEETFTKVFGSDASPSLNCGLTLYLHSVTKLHDTVKAYELKTEKPAISDSVLLDLSQLDVEYGFTYSGKIDCAVFAEIKIWLAEVLSFIQLAVVVIILVLSIAEYAKCIMSSDADAMKKANIKTVKRIILIGAILLIEPILNLGFDIFTSGEFSTCDLI